MQAGYGGFLTTRERTELRDMMRKRKGEILAVRRANALLLLDKGKSVGSIAEFLLPGPDTVRAWLREFRKRRLASMGLAAYPERGGKLDRKQESDLRQRFREHPPRDTTGVRDTILRLYGVEYSRGGASKLMHRLGFDCVKPKSLPRRADPEARERFIRDYGGRMNGLLPAGTIVFVDAVHPECQSRPVHGWLIRSEKPAIRSTTGRQRLNLHAAFDLERMGATIVEGEKINADTTLRLLQKLERNYPRHRVIHVYLDNARHHHAKKLKPFLERPDCRIRLHFLPPYAPHLNPIERLWRVMHRYVTHNRFYPDFRQLAEAIMDFFNKTLPRKWEEIAETVTDNFRVITHDEYRLIG